ncbi:MAG: multicopper oxidase family protein [Phycisphaerales bacterium]|nr:multicopper oxidase family protein [Phycisphaerales bacterium]
MILKYARLAAVAMAAFASIAGCPPTEETGNQPTTDRVGQPTADFNPSLDVSLKATSDQVPIIPGPATSVLTYKPELITGDASRIASLPGSYLGPVIRARRGDRLRVRLINELSEPTIIHWHGMRVPPEMDGHPRYNIGAGEEFVYEFEVRDRAGTYWFHPHAHGFTASQVYRGLAGLLLVSDEQEDAVGLPSGDYDIPLVIQDRMFDDENQFIYPPNSSMMMDGFLGDRILVNGRPDYALSVAKRAYRLRLLNGSNSRTYKLAWSDGTPLMVIATDGGLLGRPVQRDYVTLAPGERIELWADFSQYALGSEISLESLAFSGADVGMDMMSMMGSRDDGMMGGHMMKPVGSGAAQMMDSDGHGEMSDAPPNGAAMRVMHVRVEREEAISEVLPDKLSELIEYRLEDASNAGTPRRFSVSVAMSMMSGMQWGFDGLTFQQDDVADHEVVPFNTLEVWEFVNETAPMAMNHPLHVHGVQFQVIDRSVMPDFAAGWESVRDGYVDNGWKDTLLVMPGERVKLLIQFSDFPGEYLYHCHNLEHEDGGMMRNIRVDR